MFVLSDCTVIPLYDNNHLLTIPTERGSNLAPMSTLSLRPMDLSCASSATISRMGVLFLRSVTVTPRVYTKTSHRHEGMEGGDHWLPVNRASCPPTNCNTNTGVVGRFGVISNDYSLIFNERMCLASTGCCRVLANTT